jgi:hypothetical protein
VSTLKHGQDCSIRIGGLQEPLMAEQEGFVRPMNQGATIVNEEEEERKRKKSKSMLSIPERASATAASLWGRVWVN